MKAASPTETAVADRAAPTPLEGGINPSGLVALFWLTLRQHTRGRRLIVLIVLFLLPAGLAVLVRSLDAGAKLSGLELALIYTLIPHVLAPLAALLYASGMIQDEIEEQTLTYLLMRPIPRWALYGIKLIATCLVCTALAGVFTVVTFVAIYWDQPHQLEAIFPNKALATLEALSLSLLTYCTIFGLISLFARRSLVVGVAYIVIFEGLLANIDFMVRRFTVMYYFRVLCMRWADLKVEDWSIDLSIAPGAQECVVTLVAASAFALCFGAITFASREFRLKTPEGS